MRVAVLHTFRAPLVLQDRPTPTPGPGQVVVRIEASGLCHTDIHASQGDWPVKPGLPFAPGREGVGTIESAGPGARLPVGTRVAIPWLHVVADGDYVVEVPNGVDPFDVAPLTCAGVTTYKAVKVSGTRPANKLAVFGIGGLGHMAVQYARIAGAEVIAVDIDDAKLDMARKIGATHLVNAASDDPVATIQKLGGADQCVVTAASREPIMQALNSLRRNGTIILVGLSADNQSDLPIFQSVLGGATVKGAIVGTRQDLREDFGLHARDLTSVVREIRPLDRVNESIADVLAGRVEGRIVFDPNANAA